MNDRIPDIAAEVIAFRTWHIAEPDSPRPQLLSLNRTPWPHDDWLWANCGNSDEGIPHEGCSCGIYAAKNLSHLVRMRYNDQGERPVAIGEVGLAGKIIPGTQGWKGEKARPVRLWVPYLHWAIGHQLSLVYDIPVGVVNTSSPLPRSVKR